MRAEGPGAGRRLALAAAVIAAIAGVGCQRAPMEPPAPPPVAAPADSPAVAADPTLRTPVRPPATRPPVRLPESEVAVEGVDVIVHGPVARDRVIRERTVFWMDFWTNRSREYFERYLERMGRYGSMVDRELELLELPPSLRYLPLVESGYHHSVSSRVGATGMWQLMPPTARGLGLMVDGMVDDRRDPVMATRAALTYLQELHDQFGSWYLALAAYNAGPGRVGGILRRYAPDETMDPDERFLRIRPHLPAETREFVPRFFAAATLASDPERHGFNPIGPVEPFDYEEVAVPDATSFDVIALAAGVDESEIEELNPQYMRRFTPAGVQRIVRVPVGAGERFRRNYALIPPEARVSFMEHRVASGETLTHIARRYRVSLADLNGANRGLDPRRLQIGQRIVVPVGSGDAGDARTALVRAGVLADEEGLLVAEDEALATDADRSAVAEDQAARLASIDDAGDGGGAATARPPMRHVVERGESLWTIARRHGIGVDALRRLNGLGESDVLHPGQELVVGAGVRVHRVQRGETWIGIARRYGVSTAALAGANGRTTRDVIRVGEELRIPGG